MKTVHRVAGRLTHLPSGRVYNLDFNPPKNPVSKTKTNSTSLYYSMI